MAETVVDYAAGVPSATAIRNAGHIGAVRYISPPRPGAEWMKGKPIHRPEVDDFDAHGLQFAFVWQYGKDKNPDVMRGARGGELDARAAQEHLNSIQCAGHPVFFAVDFDITLDQWNNTARHYFKAACDVLGKQRVGIYGHSRVVHWAMEDDVVATVSPGRILGWQTRSWSNGVVAHDYAVLYQRIVDTAATPGPVIDGITVDVNDVLHPEWGWRALDAKATPSVTNLPHVDHTRWLTKHYTKGRGGRKVKYITRHHTAGVLNIDQLWNVWQQRAASAHFLSDPDGQIGQLVRTGDTAWSNADSVSNQESITIEHSNSAGASADWPINDATIVSGAKLAAELCIVEGLGRPQFGVNIRDHREFTSTSCPYHLASGGKYHDRWMQVAQQHYDNLTTATPATDSEELELSDTDKRRIELTMDQLAGPGKITGGEDAGLPDWTGWDYKSVLEAAQHNLENGMGLTLVQQIALVMDGQAKQQQQLDQLTKIITEDRK